MFKSLEIERFRGIKHSRIDDLKRINLFFGKNNCGKSSLLDAIFLVAGSSNPMLPLNINLLRDYRRLSKSDMLLDFFAMDSSLPITIRALNDEVRELTITMLESANANVDLFSRDNNLTSINAESHYGLKLNCTVDGKRCESSIILYKKGEGEVEPKVTLDNEYKETLKCTYLTAKYDFQTSIEGLVNVIKNKDEQFIVEALRLIEPRLMDFVLSQNDVLVDIGYDQRIPINMMGDGARKVLSILTTIYDCKNGIVLIDEISNGFHYSVMKGMWQSIMNAAERNGVQIFATTHDIDSIKGLRDAALPSENDSVACFKLQRTSDAELKPYHYSLESVDYSLNQEIEMR